MTFPKLIGVYSSRPQSGKSTLANRLEQQYGYTREPFAGTLKRMLDVLLEDAGLTAKARYNCLYGTAKATPIPELGNRTPRHLMQTLGTEWGRNLVSPDLWVDVWKSRVLTLMARGPVVVDDMRFHSEYEAIVALGGKLVRVEREADYPVEPPTGGHASEGALNGAFFHETITNDSTVARFHRIIDAAMGRLS